MFAWWQQRRSSGWINQRRVKVRVNIGRKLRTEFRGENLKIEIRRLGRRRSDLRPLGAVGPAEFDFGQPGENGDIALLCGFPDQAQQNGSTFGTGALHHITKVRRHLLGGHFNETRDVRIIRAEARVSLEQALLRLLKVFGSSGLFRSGHEFGQQKMTRSLRCGPSIVGAGFKVECGSDGFEILNSYQGRREMNHGFHG